MSQELIADILSLLCILAGLGLFIYAFIRHMKERKQARKKQPAKSMEDIYPVGSPEYHAQIVKAVYDVNERLAKENKHIPEKIAIDIIEASEKGEF